ncbi:DUF769 domain-containing protein [Xylella fastidiosa]|uniref:DUF769 domain-containing protein n=1 Tax=Xylella fastidiosa TaxID=2371 RepID=UPI0007078573|nr:DUF769 domain-containing protein [Xylella fastidiosa]KQH73040.1 hypothetical protein AOT81_10520 [Xylella fastidiosa]WNY18547.1 DUF769 domain-containing protein [Xylella fastidiosa]WNY20833.1 DUF769 domain-containing protein [Xylella fastidiosa]
MQRRPLLGVSLLAASLLLAGCSSGPPIDYRTGKPMMAGPWENRDLSLEDFNLDFLGQYTVKHAFINGINIGRCYPGSPPDHVQVVMMSFPDGSSSPGIIVMGRGHPPSPLSKTAAFIGSERSNTYDEQLPDGTRQKKVVTWRSFSSLCSADFAGRNNINFGIRSAASETIQMNIQEMTDLINESGIRSKRAFLDTPRTETRWGNTWTWYRALIPTPVGDGVETWMTPIGNSGYYITVNFNFIEAARQQNTEDYQRARKLMDGILQSVVIQKK